MRDTLIRIDLQAIRRNARKVREMAGGTCCLGIVKADAYGHNAPASGHALVEEGFGMLAVARVEEGVVLRDTGITAPILVLGVSNRDAAVAGIENNLILTVSDGYDIEIISGAAEETGKPADVHVTLDTGMSRIGFRSEADVSAAAAAIRDKGSIRVRGAFTHFCHVDDREFTRFQNSRFVSMSSVIKNAFPDTVLHASASYASMMPEYRYDMIRAGIILYGGENDDGRFEFAQQLVTKPVRIHMISEGEYVGYSRTFRAERDTMVMTVPVGYADGYPRSLGNRASVLVNGKRAPIIGNVCMDMLMADVTGIPGVTRDSEVVLLGSQGTERITPVELAEAAGTIPYEIMTGFSPRLQRVVVND